MSPPSWHSWAPGVNTGHCPQPWGPGEPSPPAMVQTGAGRAWPWVIKGHSRRALPRTPRPKGCCDHSGGGLGTTTTHWSTRSTPTCKPQFRLSLTV